MVFNSDCERPSEIATLPDAKEQPPLLATRTSPTRGAQTAATNSLGIANNAISVRRGS
jgi:hypothetical protein